MLKLPGENILTPVNAVDIFTVNFSKIIFHFVRVSNGWHWFDSFEIYDHVAQIEFLQRACGHREVPR